MTPIKNLINKAREKYPLANQIALDENDFNEYMTDRYDDDFDILPINNYYKEKGVGSVIVQYGLPKTGDNPSGMELYDLRTFEKLDVK
jgi:hypothetical protein